MEAARTSEMLVNIQLRIRHYIPDDSELQLYFPLWQLWKWCQLFPRATSFKVAGSHNALPLAVGFSNPLGLFEAARRASYCLLVVVPTVTFFSPLGYLYTMEFLWDDFTSFCPQPPESPRM
jgi:hypothetical protein